MRARPPGKTIHEIFGSIAVAQRRCGYRRLHFFLAQEGFVLNHKKLRRLYREERLQVHRRGGRKRAIGTRAPMTIPQGANQRWSLDLPRTRPPMGAACVF